MNPQQDTWQSILRGALAGLVLAAVFLLGYAVRDLLRPNGFASQLITVGSYPLLDEVQARLDADYLREQPSAQAREYGAIRGLLATLNDNYSIFVEPTVAQSENDVLAGTYGGIGVQIKHAEDGRWLLFPFADSPAAQAGVVNGDQLLAVNDVNIPADQQPDALDQQLRGEVKDNNGVTITIRTGDAEPRTLTIPFAVINVPSVVWRVLEQDARIGYIQILLFTDRTPDELTAAVNDLRAAQIDALVLDLRNNPGGYLRSSIAVASQFLDGGVVLYEKNRNGEREYLTEGGGILLDLPMIVLVNKGTASAAELVAGALRDRDRAILIGQATFGKGTVQNIYALSGGSSLHVTVSEWFTPSRTPLEGQGLAPTIAMIADETGRDVELGEAVRQLAQQLP
jgi:carboxyl-terminal processing protease